MVEICETLMTDGLGKPVRPARQSTFPGAAARFRLEVNDTAIVVPRVLRLKGSD
jgi:hypothetical protein